MKLCSEDEREAADLCECCPMRALGAGDMVEFSSEYGNNTRVKGFEYSATTHPSVVIKSKQKSGQ